MSDDRSDAMGAAIAQVIADHADHPSDRGIMTGWVVAAEMAGDDGDSYIRLLWPELQPLWRTLGLVEYVSADARAAVARNAQDD